MNGDNVGTCRKCGHNFIMRGFSERDKDGVLVFHRTGREDLCGGCAQEISDVVADLGRKWQNVTAQKCKEIHDVLATLHRCVGHLPEGAIPYAGDLGRGGYLQEYAERVLAADRFWASVPESILAEYKGGIGRDCLRENLRRLLDQCR